MEQFYQEKALERFYKEKKYNNSLKLIKSNSESLHHQGYKGNKKENITLSFFSIKIKKLM